MAEPTVAVGSKSSGKGGKTDEAVVALKLAFLELLDDPEMVAALRAALGLGSVPDVRVPLGGSDAEQAAVVVELIERTVRPDALRRAPTFK